VKKTLIILRHEFQQTIRRKSFLILTLAFPILVVLGFGVYQGVQHWYQPPPPKKLKIGFVDQTGLFEEYADQSGMTFIRYPSEEEAKADLLAEEIREYFLIPADYLSTGLITRYTLERELEPPAEIRTGLRNFLLSNLLAGKLSPEILERVKTPLLLNSLRLEESGEVAAQQNPLLSFFLPYIFALLFILSIFFTSGYLQQGVGEEKESRVVEILLSSVSAKQLLAGKVLGLGAAGLLQMVIWLITIKLFVTAASINIPLLSQLSIPLGLLILAILYFILGYLLFAALLASVSSIFPTARESSQWSSIFTVPAAMLPMMFISVITSHPEGIPSRVLTLFPLTTSITAMVRLPSGAMPAWEVALSLIILAGSVAGAMWAAAKVFRLCLLMYGQRPSLKELLRYVAEA